MKHTDDWYASQFAYQHELSPWKRKYADFVLLQLRASVDTSNFTGSLSNYDRGQIESQLVSDVKQEFGINPIVWFFIKPVVIWIIQHAIEYWLSRVQLEYHGSY